MFRFEFARPFSFYPRIIHLLTLGIALTVPAAAQTLSLHELDLPDVREGNFEISSQHPRLVLVAFLSLLSDLPSSPSLKESVFLSSMQRQYAERGLCVVTVDTSSARDHRYIARNEIANVATNWHMNFPVLDGSFGGLIGRFGSDDSPTILLMDSSGKIMHLWHGYTRPAFLAQEIERALGEGPLSRIPKLAESNR